MPSTWLPMAAAARANDPDLPPRWTSRLRTVSFAAGTPTPLERVVREYCSAIKAAADRG